MYYWVANLYWSANFFGATVLEFMLISQHTSKHMLFHLCPGANVKKARSCVRQEALFAIIYFRRVAVRLIPSPRLLVHIYAVQIPRYSDHAPSVTALAFPSV